MNRQLDNLYNEIDECLPHTRGDEPYIQGASIMILLEVYPTHVGMNRIRAKKNNKKKCLPHTRGDEPQLKKPLYPTVVSTPHTWG